MDSEDPNSAPLMWIAKWVDYSDKYGFGYQLSDDSIGVSFNDTSKMVLIPDNSHIQYIDRCAQEHFYTKERCPLELQKKLKLLNYFQQYMSENLIKVCKTLRYFYTITLELEYKTAKRWNFGTILGWWAWN